MSRLLLIIDKTYCCFYSIQNSSGELSEDQRHSVIENIQDLTGRQLDYDVIEMVLSESNWKGILRLPSVECVIVLL